MLWECMAGNTLINRIINLGILRDTFLIFVYHFKLSIIVDTRKLNYFIYISMSVLFIQMSGYVMDLCFVGNNINFNVSLCWEFFRLWHNVIWYACIINLVVFNSLLAVKKSLICTRGNKGVKIDSWWTP